MNPNTQEIIKQFIDMPPEIEAIIVNFNKLTQSCPKDYKLKQGICSYPLTSGCVDCWISSLKS